MRLRQLENLALADAPGAGSILDKARLLTSARHGMDLGIRRLVCFDLWKRAVQPIIDCLHNISPYEVLAWLEQSLTTTQNVP
jgi:hypothetical protein